MEKYNIRSFFMKCATEWATELCGTWWHFFESSSNDNDKNDDDDDDNDDDDDDDEDAKDDDNDDKKKRNPPTVSTLPLSFRFTYVIHLLAPFFHLAFSFQFPCISFFVLGDHKKVHQNH